MVYVNSTWKGQRIQRDSTNQTTLPNKMYHYPIEITVTEVASYMHYPKLFFYTIVTALCPFQYLAYVFT